MINSPWEEVSWYKLSGWKKDIEKKNIINKSSKKEYVN